MTSTRWSWPIPPPRTRRSPATNPSSTCPKSASRSATKSTSGRSASPVRCTRANSPSCVATTTTKARPSATLVEVKTSSAPQPGSDFEDYDYPGGLSEKPDAEAEAAGAFGRRPRCQYPDRGRGQHHGPRCRKPGDAQEADLSSTATSIHSGTTATSRRNTSSSRRPIRSASTSTKPAMWPNPTSRSRRPTRFSTASLRFGRGEAPSSRGSKGRKPPLSSGPPVKRSTPTSSDG